MQAYKNIGNYT